MENETLDIDDGPEPDFEIEEVEVGAPEVTRKGVGMTSLVATGLIAALLGTVGGAAAAYYLRAPAVNLSGVDTQLSQARVQVSTLEKRLATLEARPAPIAAPAAMPDLSDITTRLDALESRPLPEIDADALSALKAAQADGFDWPDSQIIEETLLALDSRLTALENAPPPAATASVAAAPGFSMTLEPPAPPAPTTQFVLAFPKDAMIRAVENNQTGGLMARTLAKHVRVKDANDPRTLIDGIEADISDGRLDLAVKKFDRLPSYVRDAGRAWYESVPQKEQ